MSRDLSAFTVAGYDDERHVFTEPVEVRCVRCGTRARFGEFAGTVHDSGAPLQGLARWAERHRCPGLHDLPVPVARKLVAV